MRYTSNLLFTDSKRPAQLVFAGSALPDIRLVITDYYKGAVNDVILMKQNAYAVAGPSKKQNFK